MRARSFITTIIFVIIMGSVGFLVFSSSSENKSSQSASMEQNLNQSQNKSDKPASVREPKVAGQFYSADKEKLSRQIDEFMEKAELSGINRKVRGLVLPHAGYIFSGQVAAYGAKAIQNQEIERVILIGSSHNMLLEKAAIDGSDKWQTPLGNVALDTQMRRELIQENDLFEINSEPHKSEHSLEVELPFLQKAVSGDFKILPILLGYNLKEDDLDQISQTLKPYLDQKTIIIASSDLSHYPSYENANKVDQRTIEAILSGETEKLDQVVSQKKDDNIPELATSLCAKEAVKILMKTLKNNTEETKLLKYMNTGDSPAGEKSNVVGYGAVAFLGDSILQKEQDSENDFELNLNQNQKQTLLKVAEQSLKVYFRENRIPEFNIEDELLNRKLGAFVTLKKNGNLRGCIGVFEPDKPLYEVVSQMAVSAAIKDKRFDPVIPDELGDLEYEISVLSPLKKIDDWREIELGKHGVQVRQNGKSGVFLPQVAIENSWDLDQFMTNLCQNKAGIDAYAWKNGQAEIYIFTAHIVK